MRQRLVAAAATCVVAAALAGCSGGGPGAHAGPTSPSSGSADHENSPTATPPSGKPPVRVTPSGKPKPPPGTPTNVGGLVLRLPHGWHVHKGPGKGSAYVTTGACNRAALSCPGFRVMGPAQIGHGHRGHAFKPGEPFFPAKKTEACPASGKLVQRLPGHPKSSGYGAVGHKQAVYYQWTVSCVTKKKPKVKSIFYQWEWYLPQSKMLIVDQWSTGGLGKILKWAKFA